MPDDSISPPRRIGVLDVGTNTVKSLVAEGRGRSFRVLAERIWGTRLGEGIASGGSLGEVAMARTLRAAADARREFDALGVEKRRAVATSAAREAANGAEFARRFRETVGFELRVLSGEEEAALAFLATAGDPALVPPGTGAVVMNAGGGSAEWASGTAGHVEQRVSLSLGCVRMTERFLRGDPYAAGSLQELAVHYATALAAVARDFPLEDRTLVGTGGSICAVAAILSGESDFREEAVHGRVLSAAEVEATAERLVRMTAGARRAIPSLPAQRADIVTAGALLYAAAMRALGAARIVVSARGLRYGVLFAAGEAAGASARVRR